MSRQPADDRQDLHQRYEELEHTRGHLQEQVREAEAENGRREVRLLHVGSALLKERRDRGVLLWGSIAVAFVLISAAVFLLIVKPERPQFSLDVVYKTHTPRLMITSTPPNAQVLIDGKTAGDTPLVRPSPPRGARYTVELRAAGYDSWKKSFVADREAGRHVHAELGQATKAINR